MHVFAALKTLLLADLPINIKTRIYASILRPTVTYGHELYNSNINTELINKFERYWLWVSGRMWRTETELLYKNMNITPMVEYLKKKSNPTT